MLAPEEMGHCGHDGDQGDAAEDDQGQDHHVITQEVQLAMINASKSEKQESRHHQNLQTQTHFIFPFLLYTVYYIHNIHQLQDFEDKIHARVSAGHDDSLFPRRLTVVFERAVVSLRRQPSV